MMANLSVNRTVGKLRVPIPSALRAPAAGYLKRWASLKEDRFALMRVCTTRKADRDPPYGKSNRRRRMRIGQETNTGPEQDSWPATSRALRAGQGCLRAEGLTRQNLEARRTNPFRGIRHGVESRLEPITNNLIHRGIAYLLAIPIV